MVKRRLNITLCMMFMLGMLSMHYAHAAEITIPDGYSLQVNDGTLHLPEEGINNAGVLQVTTGAIKLGGNWTNTGTFIPGTGAVELIGTTSQTISGVNTFYNLICTSAGNQLTFEAVNIQTILANCTLTGVLGNLLTLRSSVDGTQWKIDPQGTRDITYVDVKDSHNINVTPIAPQNWTNRGNNTNWVTTQTNAATLVAQWEFDGNFTAVNDSNYNGNPSGTVTFVQGQVGQAASFDGGIGVGSYNPTIDKVDSGKLTSAAEFNGGYSIMGWINPRDLTVGRAFWEHDQSCCGTEFMGFNISVQPPGILYLFNRDNSDRRIAGQTDAGNLTVNEWAHVAATWDGNPNGGIKLYINGREMTVTLSYGGNPGFTGLNSTGMLPVRIGASFADSANNMYGFNGSIDHISLYDYRVNSARKSLYNKGYLINGYP